jgi:hypothetical protein
MKFVRLYRDAGAASPGGQAGPSLADLDDPNYKPPSLEDPNNPTPSGDEPPADVPTEGLDAEGNLLEGYEKAEDGSIKKIGTSVNSDDKPGDDEIVEADPVAFYEEVQAKTNFAVDVDYEDVDPLSAEGVALRETAIVEQAERSYDDYIRTNMPRAYAYMLHTKNGGTDDEFFAVKKEPLADKDTFSNDVEAQRQFLIKDLVAKDVPEEVAKMTVDQYVKTNVLTEKAIALYDKKKGEETALLQAHIDRDKALKQEFDNSVATLTGVISQGIEKEMRLVIPNDKKKAFNEFVIDNIQHDGKDFFLAQKLNPKEITPGFLEALYLQFVKGDVSALIKKEAKKQTVQRLGQRVKQDRSASSSGNPNDKQNTFIPLSQI